MYPDSEILFPPRCVPRLRNLRGPKWARLVDHVASLPDNHEDVLGFAFLISKLSSCLTCDLDSYRASLGCCTCASRTVGGYKGTDEELIQQFEGNREEVRAYLASNEISEPIAKMARRPA